MPDELFSVTLRDDGAIVVCGELDASTVERLHSVLEKLDGPLRLDLGDVEFIDSIGLHELLRQRERVGGRMHVLRASHVVRRLLELLAVDNLLLPRHGDTCGPI